MKPYFMIIVAALLCLNISAPGLAEAPKMCPVPGLATPEKEDAMFMEDLKTSTQTAIPPIDRAIPEKFETAAFGLG